MTLDREDIDAIADAVVERLLGRATSPAKNAKGLLPFDAVRYRAAIVDARNGNTATLKNYLRTYEAPKPTGS